MTAEVVPIGRRGPHLHGPARCLRCRHEWQAVTPAGKVEGLECPQCGCWTGVVQSLIEPDGERWECACGCQLFHLDAKGPPLCTSCGLRAKSWADS